ncbi:MAG: outer membrane protein assembly factor BamD [Bacteroidota bacterium]
MRNLFFVFGITFAVLISSCNGYNKLLKSTDYELKYNKAVEYYQKGDYGKCLPLLDELVAIYRLTDKAEIIYYYYAWCHYHIKEYYLAAYYFKSFARSFPDSKYAEECHFMSAMCNVRNSPSHSLDQSETHTAIIELQAFINRYPESDKRDSCNKVMDGLRNKLETKTFENAYLYYKVEQYKAASVALTAMLEEYPDSKYKEEILYLVVKSNFNFAENSIDAKKTERFNETIKSYNTFVTLFAESPRKRELEAIAEHSKREIERLSKPEVKNNN